MAETKQSDDAADNVYYHALIDTGCEIEGCLNAGAVGIAFVAGATRDESFARVGATIWHDLDATANTFVHEVGHNQGLRHVACPGGSSANNDSSYPHANGNIGNWGYGIRSFSLHNPTASYDYMSYCDRTWTSDWTFNKTYERIQTLTSWNNESSSSNDNPGQVLIGALYPSGAEDWFVVDGGVAVDTLDASERVDFEVGGLTIEQPAAVHTLSDDETVWVVTPVPESVGFAALDSLTHVRAGVPRRVLSPSEVRISARKVQNP
nr:zinc-dependent metalloprotease family protein [Pseudenhygromyxa sp. WMMC2535]